MDIPSRHEILTREVRNEIVSLRKSQLKNTNRIIASQDHISEQLGNIDNQLADINNNIVEMSAMLGYHLSNITWLLEQQNELLQEILRVLLAPLGTMALELRNRAIEAFQNRWYTEALADFQRSIETNPYDFIAHHFLGLCYIESRSFPDALTHFNLAVKYAIPKSPLHASYSQLFVAQVHRHNSNYSEASLATEAAIRFAPEYPEAHYQHGVSLALLNDPVGAIDNIRQSIHIKPEYVLRTRSDENLAYMMSKVTELEEELYHEAKRQTESLLKDAQRVVTLVPDDESLLNGLSDVKRFYQRDSFLDFKAACEKIDGLITTSEEILESRIRYLPEKSHTGNRLASLGETLGQVSFFIFGVGVVCLLLAGMWWIVVAVTGGDTSGTLSFMGRWGLRPILWSIVVFIVSYLIVHFGGRVNKTQYRQKRHFFENNLEAVRRIKSTRLS